MATISIQLALNKSPFFLFRDNSVKKDPESFIVDTSDIDSITAIIRGIANERISSSMSIDSLKQLLPGSGGGGGGDGTGAQGLPGESAYQIAKRLGQANGMSESQWIASLKGPKGPKGDKGDKGEKGEDFTLSIDPLQIYQQEKEK